MTPEQAYRHCLKNGRNAKLEKIILTDPSWAYEYARYVIEDRWPEVENIIINDPEYAYLYARNLIKDRWPEAENVISTDPEIAYFYALEVIKGKLPENMHNAMLLHADEWAKKYLKLIIKSET